MTRRWNIVTGDGHAGTVDEMDRWGLVGRERELELLTAALERAEETRGSVVAVSGEAGIGKSQLLEATALIAASRDATVAWGRAWEAGGAPPLLPWREVLDQLGAVWPKMRNDDEYAEFGLFDSVSRELAEKASEASPGSATVVLLDDLHAADLGTLHVLSHVAGRIGWSRLLVVAAWRDTEARLGSDTWTTLAALRAERLHLGPLPDHDVRLIVSKDIGPVEEQVATDVAELSGGNPLFAKQLASLLISGAGGVPDAVREATRRRLDLGSDALRHVLTIGALLGREFDPALVADAGDLPVERVLSVLGEAETLDLVERASLGRFRFRHALVRDAVEAALDPAERAARHLAIGRSLEASGDYPSSLLAHHYGRAVSLVGNEVAAQHVAAAGRDALAAFAPDDAERHFTTALQLVGTSASPDERARLLTGRAQCLVRLSRIDAARSDLEGAIACSRVGGSAEVFADAVLGLTSIDNGAGRTPAEESVSLLRAALDAVPSTDHVRRNELMLALAEALWWQPEAAAECEALLTEARALADRLGDTRLRAQALGFDFFANTYAGGPAAVGERMRALDGLARGCDHLRVVDLHRVARFVWALSAGDLRQARHCAAAARAAGERYGVPGMRWRAISMAVTLELVTGSLAEAERLLQDAQAAGRTAGSPTHIEIANLTQSMLTLRRRAREEDIEGLRDIVKIAIADSPNLTTPVAGLASCHLILGDASEARGTAQAAVNFAQRLPRDLNWLSTIALASEVLSEVGDIDLVEALRGELEPWSGWHAVVSTGYDVFGPVDRALGLLAARSGDGAEAEKFLDAALAADTSIGAWSSVIWTKLLWSRMLARRGEGGDAAAAARHAADVRAIAATHEVPGAYEFALPAAQTVPRQRGQSVPVSAATATLAVAGSAWRVTFDDVTVEIRQSRGMQPLASLLATPGAEIHVLDLAGASVQQRDLGPTLDDTARGQYLRRAEDLRDDLADAERDGDIGRIDKIRDELEFIAAELSGGVGRHGRARPSGATTERVRVSTTKALRAAIARIGEHFPELGGHLEVAVRTGMYCRYEPDPTTPITWTVRTS